MADRSRRASDPSRKRNRRSARAEAERFRRMFEDAPLGVCWAAHEGRILEANRALAEMLGYADPADLVGKDAGSFYRDRLSRNRVIESLTSEGEVRDFEIELVRRNGSVFPARVTSRKIEWEGAVSYQGVIEDITAEKRSRQALLESEEKLNKIFQTSLDAITINSLPEGRYLEMNEEFLRLSGYERDEVIGRTPIELDIWVDPRQLRLVLYEIERRGIVHNLEADFRLKDGSILSTLFSAERVAIGPNGSIVSVVRDITERKKAEEALRESERRYRSLFEESNDVIFITDAKGMLTDVNPAGVSLLGCESKEELLRSGTGSQFYDKPEIQTALSVKLAREGQLRNVEVDLHRKDGRKLKVILNATAVRDSSGGIIGVRGSIRDITERSRLQEQLLHAQRLEAVGRLAGGIAHDFNNLLTVIRSSAGLALLGLAPGDPLRARLEEVDEAARRSAELTKQLLAFARRQIVTPEVLDLGELIGKLERMLRRVLGADIELVTRLTGGWAVRADRGQLEQVVLNLAVNARDAMPLGGRLVLETSNVTLTDGEHPAGVGAGEFMQLTVSDTGCGMDPETRAHIFEPFYTTKEVGKGSGLGLAICYGIVVQGGGHIDVESEPDRGTTFRILLPRELGKLETASAQSEAARPGGRERILVLEDEPLVRRLIAATLRSGGYTVLEAESGPEAIGLAGSDREPPDLLVSDVVLPRMGGCEAAGHIRRLTPGIRLLFISGHSDDSSVERQVRDGVAAFLQKPFTPDVLLREVRRLLDGSSGRP